MDFPDITAAPLVCFCGECGRRWICRPFERACRPPDYRRFRNYLLWLEVGYRYGHRHKRSSCRAYLGRRRSCKLEHQGLDCLRDKAFGIWAVITSYRTISFYDQVYKTVRPTLEDIPDLDGRPIPMAA